MTALRVFVEGVGVWAPDIADFPALRDRLSGAVAPAATAKPPAVVLSPNDRRRAPDSVLIATEVAHQAVMMSGHSANALPCLFASAYGDQAITDYMCATLAETPTALSPTRFHNSVQNAPAGYWTIATGCHESSSAVCAGDASFGAGLLEAVVLACVEDRPVLFVCSDTVGQGPVGNVAGSRRAFGCALVLSTHAGDGSMASLRLNVGVSGPATTSLPSIFAGWIDDNPSAAALPLLAMLASAGGRGVIAAAEQLHVGVEMESAK